MSDARDTRGKELFREFLHHIDGIPNPSDIEPGQIRTADFTFTDTGNTTYLLEVTTRANASTFRREIDHGQQALHEERVEKKASLAQKLRDKTHQLRETPGASTALRVIGVLMEGVSPEAELGQLRATLLGIVSVATSLDNIERYAFYFDHADFSRRTDLDAVIGLVDLGADVAAHILANPHSPRYDWLRSSVLYRHFFDHGGLLDPYVAEERGDGFIVDPEYIGRSDREVERHLSEKYGLAQVRALRWQHVTAGVLVSAPNEDESSDRHAHLTTR